MLGQHYERAQRTAPRSCFRAGITSHGPIQPMPEHDRIAWRITRERHPKYYRKEVDNAEGEGQ